MVQKYGIKNSDSFCSFYSKHMGVNKKHTLLMKLKNLLSLIDFQEALMLLIFQEKQKLLLKIFYLNKKFYLKQ